MATHAKTTPEGGAPTHVDTKPRILTPAGGNAQIWLSFGVAFLCAGWGLLLGVFHGLRVELARLIDRGFPPALPDGLQREYFRSNYRFARWPLILLGPFGALATLGLLALNDDIRPQLRALLMQPEILGLLALVVVSWVVMLRSRRITSFGQACVAFMVCVYALMGTICHEYPGVTPAVILQMMVWQLTIAPLVVRTGTFIATLCISMVAPVLLMTFTNATPATWIALIFYLIPICAVAVIVYRACNRLRRETYLSNINMRESAFTDSLTGLLTRRRFMELASRSMSFSESSKASVCACFIDLDDFKQINDRYGHAFGDRVLSEAALCIRALGGHIREADTTLQARHVISGRVGGEEFALMMFGHSLHEALEIADEVLMRVRRIEVDGVRISTSIGVACARPDESMRSLLHRADMALLDAKTQGKDRIVASPGIAGR